MKITLKILLLFVILLKSSYVLSNEPSPKNISIYTSWYVSQSDHCGGFTVTFVQNKFASKGYLQTYEGNCISTKLPVKLNKFDKKTGAVQFSALDPDNTERDSQRVEAEWRFNGYVQKISSRVKCNTVLYTLTNARLMKKLH
jgi:hypothetical protein